MKPVKVVLEATAPDWIQASWEGEPGDEGYRVELFRFEDGRETDIPDFSGLASDAWPSGWTYADLPGGFGWYLSDKLVKLVFKDCWFTSPFYPKPITEFRYKFKSEKEKTNDEVKYTQLVVCVSKTESGDDWIEFDRRQVTTATSNVVCTIDFGMDVHRLRFSVDYKGSNQQYADGLSLGVDVLSIVQGTCVEEFVARVESTERSADFPDLDATASYFVTVCPTPSEDPELVATSDTLDLSKEYFRRTGARPVTRKELVYEERFDSLSNFVTQTKTVKMKLDFWQFLVDGAEPASLGLSQTNTTPQIAGCYVCRDKEKVSDVDSVMIGTLAGGEHDCAVGLALKNNTGRKLKGLKVTFDSVQRGSYAKPATYVFEWRITDGGASIAAGSDWEQACIPETAPVTSENRTPMEYRQRDIVVAIPAKLPEEKTVVFRWRHPKITSGPMMAVDNVRISFDKPEGFVVTVN